MGRATHHRSITSAILLVAVAIQAIGPDTWDLASLRALDLLCLVLFDSCPCPDPEPIPEDVCGPAQPSITRKAMELVGRLSVRSLGPPASAIGTHALPFSSPPDSHIAGTDALI